MLCFHFKENVSLLGTILSSYILHIFSSEFERGKEEFYYNTENNNGIFLNLWQRNGGAL